MSTEVNISQKDTREVYIVDASAYIFRAYYAVRGLTNEKGQSTNAVFGFIHMLLKLLKTRTPPYLVMAFDRPGPTFRHKMYSEYKAHRGPIPEDLPHQIPIIHQFVAAMGIPILYVDGYEADDVIGTLCHHLALQNNQVVVVTGDKDLMQLVRPGVRLLDESRGKSSEGEFTWIGEVEVKTKFGVRPDQVPDVLGLMGDSSDNIPGVDGIGPKTASELIIQYGSLENVLTHAEEIPQKAKREKLLAQADQARLSKKLATIAVDAPIMFSEKLIQRDPLNVEAIQNIFVECGFKKWLNEPLFVGVEYAQRAKLQSQDAKKNQSSEGKKVRSNKSSQTENIKKKEATEEMNVSPKKIPECPIIDVVTLVNLEEMILKITSTTSYALRVETVNTKEQRRWDCALAWQDTVVWISSSRLSLDVIRDRIMPLLMREKIDIYTMMENPIGVLLKKFLESRPFLHRIQCWQVMF